MREYIEGALFGLLVAGILLSSTFLGIAIYWIVYALLTSQGK